LFGLTEKKGGEKKKGGHKREKKKKKKNKAVITSRPIGVPRERGDTWDEAGGEVKHKTRRRNGGELDI